MYKAGDEVYVPGGATAEVKHTLRDAREVETSLGTFPEADLVRVGDEDTRAGVYRSFREKPRTDLDRRVEERALSEALSMLPLDVCGHFMGGLASDLFTSHLRDQLFTPKVSHLSVEDIRALLGASRDGVPLDRWLEVMVGQPYLHCPYCDDSSVMETNGVELRFKTRCPNSAGLPITRVRVNVPSGRLLVLSEETSAELFKLPPGKYDINRSLDRLKRFVRFAEIGLAQFWVAYDASPGIFELDEGELVVALAGSEDPTPTPPGKALVPRLPDGPWVSLCDLDEYEVRCRYFGVDPATASLKQVAVSPGEYEFEYRPPRGPYHAEVRIRRVGPPLPRRDLLKSWRDTRVTPSQWVASNYQKRQGSSPLPWGSMTPKQRLTAWAREAEYVFFVNRCDAWHEGGFPICEVSEDAADVGPVPQLRFQGWWWYRDVMGRFPKRMSPEYAELAFRVLESIVSFGPVVRADQGKVREVGQARELMREALRELRGLVVLYPALADPEYAWWLSDGTRADEWVENFPLGPDEVTGVVWEDLE